MNTQDTIAAIATPVGTAGIGVIRVSGPMALEIASRVFEPAKGTAQTFPSHSAHYGTLYDTVKHEPIDDVVITVFRAPRSYTGEDIIEISCHGSVVILKSALGAVLKAGARLAEPGEFTRRAFLNGKIDLAQAEAVNDLIRAGTDDARRVALRQLDGKLSENVSAAREKLLVLIASIEAAIDFPDDVDEPEASWIESRIVGVEESINTLLSSFGKGRIYREGLRVVIAGRVNVGKSSLLNALLRHARSIVTPIPGTTRDIIEESLEIEGIPIVAIDTAGFGVTDDPVEKIGIELTEKSIDSADIILLVFDISDRVNQADVEMMQRIKDRPAIAVLNKIDLVSEEARGPKTREYIGSLGRSLPAVETCASSGHGIGQLENEIAALVANKGIGGESVLVSNARHQRALQSAIESLDHALITVQTNEPIDLLSVDLVAARDSLGLITGETATDDLLDRIFTEFCIGK